MTLEPTLIKGVGELCSLVTLVLGLGVGVNEFADSEVLEPIDDDEHGDKRRLPLWPPFVFVTVPVSVSLVSVSFGSVPFSWAILDCQNSCPNKASDTMDVL